MKILIHSNTPSTPSGYGVQCALLVDRLVADGHVVAVSATWGHQCGVGSWTSPAGNKIRIYPGVTAAGDESIIGHALHFFDGNPRGGWIVALLDVWSMTNPLLCEFNVIGWAPVDHDPVPKMVVDFFERSKAIPVAMCRHGETELKAAGLDVAYAPLAIDTSVYQPKFSLEVDGRTVSSREFFDLPNAAFVVGMVAMNKDPMDRKGFDVALQAFAKFHANHPESILFIHTEQFGIYGGLNLQRIAESYGIPSKALTFTEPYAYRIGFPPNIMAALYTACDVLLAPSAGEGFCVPLIEAQACGVPVIVSDFTSQPELVGAGWKVEGQRQWDPASNAHYFRAYTDSVVARLEEAHDADLAEMQTTAMAFASRYDIDVIYSTCWRPFLASLDETPPADKPAMESVAILIPAMKRPQNVERLVDSFDAHWNAGIYYICDEDDLEQIEAVRVAGANLIISDRGSSFAGKINCGFNHTTEDWVFVCGDDVEFTKGWLNAAR
jgi:glycosyltransferase involved in cell wall biosynthesis